MENHQQERSTPVNAFELLIKLSAQADEEARLAETRAARMARLVEIRAGKQPESGEASAGQKRAGDELMEGPPAKRLAGELYGEAVSLLSQANELMQEATASELARIREKEENDSLLASYQVKLAACEEELSTALRRIKMEETFSRIAERKLKEQTERADAAVRERQELRHKVRILTPAQSLLAKARAELQKEKEEHLMLLRALEKERTAKLECQTLWLRETEAARAREAGLTAQQESQCETVQRLRRKLAEYHPGPDDILRAKREGYLQGVEMNFRILQHYGVVDTAALDEAMKDPVKRARAPREDFALQWAHLGEVGEGPSTSQAPPAAGGSSPRQL